MAAPLAKGSPPSSYAIADWIEKEPGAAKRVTILTAKRIALIWPGVFFYSLAFDRQMGIGRQILLSTIVSWSITGGLYLYYSRKDQV